ncbi:MAG: T9SS type A sorting domain-containing protein [Candidatus Zixiibacteriota bacterium]
MKTKILLTILTIAILSSPLLAQRDSLCMRMVDTWADDSLDHISETVEYYDGYFIVGLLDYVGIFHIDSTGTIVLDTMILDFYSNISHIAIKDSILFCPSVRRIHSFNIASPERPVVIDSIEMLWDRYDTPKQLMVHDTLLYFQHGYRFYECNISNPDSIREPTWIGLGGSPFSHSFPYFYDGDAGRNEYRPPEYFREFIIHEISGDSIVSDTFRIESNLRQWISLRDFTVIDSFFFMALNGGNPEFPPNYVLEAYKYSSSLDSIWLLDSWEDTLCHLPNTAINSKDSLLFLSVDNWFYVFSATNPADLQVKAYYHDPNATSYLRAAIIGSLLVVPTYFEDSLGISIFEYPCSTCDGNCELEQEIPNELNIDVFPNPFNSICQIELPDFREPSQLRILDINGNTIVDKKIESDIKIYPWNAKDLPSGVYLITLINGQTTITRKVFLIK